MKNAVGILGGTFNPVHNGHIAVAEAAAGEFNLQKVIFLPNGNPPHKQDSSIVSAKHRYNMISLAISDNPLLDISDYEIKRTEPSYTIDTQRALKKIYNCDLYFIIGADSLYTLHQWKSYDLLIKECSFIVADRNCDEGSDIETACRALRDKGCDIRTLRMDCVDVTSTQVRHMISHGIDVDNYIPDSVVRYICENALYTCKE